MLGAVVALLAVAAVAAGVVILTGGKSTSSASRSSAGASLASHRTSLPSAVQPSTVTVSVLNGTDQLGLAGEVSGRLTRAGYRKGAVSNASDQTHATTVVQYAAHDQRDALAVATSLKLGRTSVQPLDSATQRIACSAAPLGCTSHVVVTVGKNLATP